MLVITHSWQHRHTIWCWSFTQLGFHIMYLYTYVSHCQSQCIHETWVISFTSNYLINTKKLEKKVFKNYWYTMYYFTITYWAARTGWTSRSGSCISLLWWSTDASRTRHRNICRTTVCQSLKLPVVSNCDLPLVISFYWSHNIVSEHSAVGLLLWLARRSGTHWQINCELTLIIGLNQLWRLSSLPLTSVFSILQAFAVMRYINLWLTLTKIMLCRPIVALFILFVIFCRETVNMALQGVAK